MVQQVARCRDIEELIYYFDRVGKIAFPFDEDESATRKHTREADQYALKHFDQHMGGFDSRVSDLFVDLYCDYIIKQNAYNSNKYIHFKNIIRARGFVDSNDTQMSSPIKKVVNELATDYDRETFNAEEHLDGKLNQILNMNINQIKSYWQLFVKNYEATKHFNTCKLFLYSADKKENLISNLKYTRDSNIKKIQSTDSQVNFVNKVMKYIGFHVDSSNEFQCVRAYNASDSNAIFEEYKMIFKHRGKNPLVFTTKHECLKNVYKFITNSTIFVGGLATSSAVKRKGKKLRVYTLETKALDEHTKIYNIRQATMVPDRCMVDDDDDDDDDDRTPIENFGIDIDVKPTNYEVKRRELNERWGTFGFTIGQQDFKCECDYCKLKSIDNV